MTEIVARALDINSKQQIIDKFSEEVTPSELKVYRHYIMSHIRTKSNLGMGASGIMSCVSSTSIY